MQTEMLINVDRRPVMQALEWLHNRLLQMEGSKQALPFCIEKRGHRKANNCHQGNTLNMLHMCVSIDIQHGMQGIELNADVSPSGAHIVHSFHP